MKDLWNTPVDDEVDLALAGSVPVELAGTYIRNGGNALPGRPSHDFAAQGMLHGIRLGDGRAEWYRNRWVKTPLLTGALPYRDDGTHDLTASTANTSVLQYAGKLLALVESSLPFQITTELATAGPFDFARKLRTPMTAHPKMDPATGRLHFFGYDVRPPFLTYHVASPDGRLLQSTQIAVPAPTMMHDFALTERYVIWLDQPVVFDHALARPGAMPFRWSAEYPTRLGVMELGSPTVRWFEVSPGYAFHVANAHQIGGTIVLEAVRYDRAAFESTWEVLGGPSGQQKDSGAHFYRSEIDLVHGKVREEAIDTAPIEFPTIDAARTGRANRFTYAVTMPRFASIGAELVKYDHGKCFAHHFEHGWIPGEAVFVPARGRSEEDHGWLMLFVGHATENRARFAIHDARTLEPTTEIELPRRVPAGFHGAWIARTV